MDPFGNFGSIIAGTVVLAVLFRLAAGYLDHNRIREYGESQGWIIESILWDPFGRGWFGSKNERTYRVVYRDRCGRVVEGICKTSMLAGVYFTDVQVSGGEIDCRRCGRALGLDAVYCSYCGGKV